MADNSRDEERDDNGPQSIFDLFEPPPDPDPNTFGKVPVVRGDDDDFDRMNGTTAAERKAAAEAEAAGLQHWTEPATGQVPAVFGSDDDRGGAGAGSGPSWQSDDSWTGPDLSDVFADHDSGSELPSDSRSTSGTVKQSPSADFDLGEGREIPQPNKPVLEPEPQAPPPTKASAERGYDPVSPSSSQRRAVPERLGPGATEIGDSRGSLGAADGDLDETRPHSRFETAPSREWDLGASSDVSAPATGRSRPAPDRPVPDRPVSDRPVSDRAVPERLAADPATPGRKGPSAREDRPRRSDFDLGSVPSRPAPPQFDPAFHQPPSLPQDRLSNRVDPGGPVPGPGSLPAGDSGSPGARRGVDDTEARFERPAADPGPIRFERIEQSDSGPPGGPTASTAPPPPGALAGHPSASNQVGAFDRPPLGDEAATAPGVFGFDDQPYRPDAERPDVAVARDARPGGRNVPKAIAVGVGLAAVAGIAMWLGPAFTMVVVVAAALLAVIELFNSMRLAGLRPAALLGILGTVATPVAAYYRGDAAYTVIVALSVVFGVLWYLAGADTERPVLNLSLTLFGVFWIGGLGSFAALILRSDAGIQLLLSTILITVVSDVLAYAGGRAYGSRPFHSVSPSKTWEGTMTGFVGAVFTGFALGVMPFETIWDTAFTEALLLGAVVGLLAPMGDLAESMVKRDLGVKDMGTILPGHGGVLDRIDALLFTLPGAYYLALTTGLL